MTKESAGVLLYRRPWKPSEGFHAFPRSGSAGQSPASPSRSGGLEVFLVHPGGPLWARKDEHAWTIPKGELGPGESAIDAAQRELTEETGIVARGELVSLGTVRQASGKIVHAWAVEQDADPARLCSNDFQLEWPPKSGRMCSFPEVDRGEWFTLPVARQKIFIAQEEFLDRLAALAHAP